MSDFATEQDWNADLIRKDLQGSVFIADDGAVAMTRTNMLMSGGALAVLPAAYEDLGHTTEAGVQFARNIETSPIKSWGRVEPSREDVRTDITTMHVVLQETKLRTLELYSGADLAALTPDANGGIEFTKPTVLAQRRYRLFELCVDVDADGDEIYMARFLPKAGVTARADQTHANDDTGRVYDVTFTGYMDETLGYSEKFIYGGPGWIPRLVAMGFPAIAP